MSTINEISRRRAPRHSRLVGLAAIRRRLRTERRTRSRCVRTAIESVRHKHWTDQLGALDQLVVKPYRRRRVYADQHVPPYGGLGDGIAHLN